MCGITLIFRVDPRPPDRAQLERMNARLTHRGPDAQAVFVGPHVGLGHTRLSIVDVAEGAQPMTTPDGRHTITFNGEIYNFAALRTALEQQGVRFRTHSDTEVVLWMYRTFGPQCLERLRGMFAFAVYDRDAKSIFIARDRLGIKPLFYHWTGSSLYAASEMKAIFASGDVPVSLNPESIRNYFTYQFSIAPNTPFSGVLELPPGHYMTLSAGGSPQLRQYWDLEFPRDQEYETDDEKYWTQSFLDGLESAAASHTIGDVPIGAYLSGGIDSATTTWLMTQVYEQPVHAFSIRFNNTELDESPIFRSIADHLDVIHSELELDDDQPDSWLPDLQACVYHLEQPQRMAVDIPHFLLSGLVQSCNYKVVYTGDGADEILGGYDCFRQDYMRLWGNEIVDPIARRNKYEQEYMQWFAREQVEMLWSLHAPAMQKRVIDKFHFYPVWYDFWNITADMLPGLFSDDFEHATRTPTQLETMLATLEPHVEGRHRINQSLYFETKTRLPGWILWKSDRLSMAHGVEARVPFMDHPLVELAARIPPDLKLNGMDEKYILKKVAAPHLPAHPQQFKKRAFYTPIREWFFTPRRIEELSAYFSQEALERTGIFNPATVERYRRQILSATAPTNSSEYYRVMKLEWVLMLVLTTQLLDEQFVRANWVN